ncbi:MAG TPA: tetratricopeptide repeat protein, partial [Thermoanaerobaculia bacterium]
HLGVVYEGLGEYDKAVQSYEKAAELDDTDGQRRDYYLYAMRAAMLGGDAAAARGALALVRKLPIEPKSDHAAIDPQAFAILEDMIDGRAADAERRLKELKPVIEGVFEKNASAGKMLPGRKPHFPDWNVLMARSLVAQGKTDEAETLWEQNANPPNPFYDFNDRRFIMEARAKVAEYVARKGDLDKAEKLIAENRKWNPSWAPCRPAETAVAEMRRAKVLAASK